VPLLACPAVFFEPALLDKPAVAPVSQSVITFESTYMWFMAGGTCANLADHYETYCPQLKGGIDASVVALPSRYEVDEEVSGG
jgi:hypothetical protein